MSIRNALRYWGWTTIAAVGLIGATSLMSTATLLGQYEGSVRSLTETHQQSLHALTLASAFSKRQAQLAIAPTREAVDRIAADRSSEAAVAVAASSLKAMAGLDPETQASINRIVATLEQVVAHDHAVLVRARAVVELHTRFRSQALLARRGINDLETMVIGMRGGIRLEEARTKRRLAQLLDPGEHHPELVIHVRDLLQGDTVLLERAFWELGKSVHGIGVRLEQIDSIYATHELLNLAVNELRQSFDRAYDAVRMLADNAHARDSLSMATINTFSDALHTLEAQVLVSESTLVSLRQAFLIAHDALHTAQGAGQASLETLHRETHALVEASERHNQGIMTRLHALGFWMQLGIALVFTLVVLATGWFIAGLSRRIHRPVQQMREAMRDVAEGELSTRLPEDDTEGDNEIALLASDFNRATAKTEQLVEQLALSNAHLEASESHIRGILNGVPDGILTLSHEGLILTSNVVAEKIFGSEPGGLLRHHFLELLREHDSEAGLQGLLRGRQTIGRRLDGSELPLWVSITASDSQAPASLIAVVTDMTAHTRLEAQHLKSEALFKTLYENAPVMVTGFDPDGRCVLWNRELERALGWSLHEINCLNDFISLLYPGTMDRKQRLAQFTQCDGIYREFSLVARDGRVCTHLWASFHLPEGLVISTGYDITARKQAEEQLQSTSKELDTILQNVQVGIAYVRDGHLVRVNRRLEELFGAGPESLNGRLLADLFQDEPGFEALEGQVAEAFAQAGSLHTELSLPRLDGGTFRCSISVTPGKDDRDAESTVWLFEDVSRRHQSEQQLLRLAKFDPLTGLPNRASFIERLQAVILPASLETHQVAVMFIDLDHFKDVNDSLGHRAGDVLLREVAERLCQVIQEPDLVARLGGDEFTVLHLYTSENDDTALLAERIIDTISRPFSIDGITADLTPSIGISRCPMDATEVGILLRDADAAMYDAKCAGRNTYRFYALSMHEAAQQRMALGAALRRAFEQRGFLLHYQPLFDLDSGDLVGVEALLRLPESDLGPLTPDVFIPVLEETGLIVPVGEWVLEQALMEARPLLDQGLGLAVNISGRQFHEPEFVTRLEALVTRAGIPPALLELELTETVLMANSEHALKSLDAISQLGIRLSVDDFGIGYSSLTYLKRFPLDTLKIDRSFIRDIPEDRDDVAIVEAILAMSRRLGLLVVAEGVETEGQRDFLRFNHCDRVQGFLYARPSPIAQVLQQLAAGEMVTASQGKPGHDPTS